MEATVHCERRKMLKLMMLGSGALVFPGIFSSCASKSDASAYIFPCSVASGDPRQDSVILWTRVEDRLRSAEDDLAVTLEVATDEDFNTIVLRKSLTAHALFDHCIKTRVDGLHSYTFYYYRFCYKGFCSRTGRTKTAPAVSDARHVRMASVSCQDYPGRYYNTYAHMLRSDDIDVIVHLGDYIYETTGDPAFQTNDDARNIVFRDLEGAIALQSDGKLYYAAASTDNYRQLYQIYRSDTVLQRIHERYPMIAIWDDHEFSDDYYGAYTNYDGGRTGGFDPQRRQNAQRAYLEYMPLEVGLDEEGVMSPQSQVMLDEKGVAVIYRDFQYGANVHLIMTDYRSYRPDHAVAEDAFPGTVFADKAQIVSYYDTLYGGGGETLFEANKERFGPYIDLELTPYESYKPLLTQIAIQMYASSGIGLIEAAQRASEAIRGKISAFVANEMIKGYNAAVSQAQQQTLIYADEGDAVYTSLERGLAYIHLGKAELFASGGVGARYMVVKEVFDIYVALKGDQNVYGDAQQAWIDEQLVSSSAAWRIYASSVSMAPMVVDLSGFGMLPAGLRQMYYIDVDQFDGFDAKRRELLEKLRSSRSVIFSGDIHATFVTDHHGVAEFTGSSISSATFAQVLKQKLSQSEVVKQIEGFAEAVEALSLDEFLIASNVTLLQNDAGFSELKAVDTLNNGYIVVEVGPDEIHASAYLLAPEFVTQRLYEEHDIDAFFSKRAFSILSDGTLL